MQFQNKTKGSKKTASGIESALENQTGQKSEPMSEINIKKLNEEEHELDDLL